MNRYLRNLVMRSLGEASGLSPRPATRYEPARRSAVAEFPESMQEPPFQGHTSWTSPVETDISHESIIERGRQTEASLPSEWRPELIRQRRQNQSRLLNLTRPSHEVSREGAAKLASPVHGPNPAVSDRREASAIPIAQRSESHPRARDRAVQPTAAKSHPPSATPHDVFGDSLRPTLKEVSFQPVHGDVLVPPSEDRPPGVRIRIGRIEVRAVEPPIPAPSKKLVESPRSSVSLDQYLRRRSPEA